MRLDWIEHPILAGGSRPGLMAPLDQDCGLLERHGFSVIVNLTRTPLVLEDSRFQVIHFPIPDMGVPTPRAAEEICRKILDHADNGRAVYVHCKAGLGRTGIILAGCLIVRGLDAENALAEVRKQNRLFVQNQLQEGFLRHLEIHVRESRMSA